MKDVLKVQSKKERCGWLIPAGAEKPANTRINAKNRLF